jgi:hypothetical protein
VDVSAGHDGLAPRSPSSLSRARSGCFLGRCRRSGPQVLRGISAPGAPRFGARQQSSTAFGRMPASLAKARVRATSAAGKASGSRMPLRAMYSAVDSPTPANALRRVIASSRLQPMPSSFGPAVTAAAMALIARARIGHDEPRLLIRQTLGSRKCVSQPRVSGRRRLCGAWLRDRWRRSP